MGASLPLHKGRTNVIPVNLAMDITGETITSQIRAFETQDSELLVDWDVDVTDASAGLITLTCDLLANPVSATKGFMDIKRGSGNLPVFAEPLAVEFKGSVTV